MNGITTIAALPSTKEQFKPRIFPGLLDAGRLGQLGYCVNSEGLIERLEFPEIVSGFPSAAEWPLLGPPVQVFEDHSFPFEPSEYTERN